MRALVWFRRDLRVEDNPALFQAAESAEDGVVAAYAITPRQWEAHDEAALKVDFWLRNLEALAAELRRLRIPLRIVETPDYEDLPERLFDLARRTGCDALFFNREYEVNEDRRDQRVARHFEAAGLPVRSLDDRVIVPPGEVLTGEGRYYTVFTPFRRSWVGRVKDSGPPAPLPAPSRQKDLRLEGSRVPDSVEGFEPDSTRADLWPAGEKAAGRRLGEFIDNRAGDYAEKRDLAAASGTSLLSPYLAAGVLSPRTCLAAALEANRGRLDSGRKGLVTWISELVWREFYTHVMVGFPRVSRNQPFRLDTRGLRWRVDPEGLAAWKEGRTGYPIVDAGMRQLTRTGWMHNRLRMITAMFLTKDLLIDWREGERHFMRHLIDGDLASNNGGWQWSASTGTDAAPYFRIFNPVSQSKKCDPEGRFIRKFCPELAGRDSRTVHEPWRLDAGTREGLDYPERIVDHAEGRKRALAAFKALG